MKMPTTLEQARSAVDAANTALDKLAMRRKKLRDEDAKLTDRIRLAKAHRQNCRETAARLARAETPRKRRSDRKQLNIIDDAGGEADAPS